ncbi:hypothetical protein BH10PSE19_BH10PSE19_21160 [soil metagenome]
MLKTASTPPTPPLVTAASSSGIGLSDGKTIASSIGPLILRRSELDSAGLLRSITADLREVKRSAQALNDERQALALLMQNAITGYVMLKEGRDNYRGEGHYDLPYIQKSTVVKTHRKRDIEAIDALIKEAEAKELPPVTLANALYMYLNTIQTGVKFLWLFRIGNKSDLRSHLHTSLKSFDPMLYWACFIDQVENYHQYQQQKPDTAKLRLASSMKADISTSSVSVEQYQLLKAELLASKCDLVNLKSQFADLEEENIAMSSVINRQKQRIHELVRMEGEYKSDDIAKIHVEPGTETARGASSEESSRASAGSVHGSGNFVKL